MKHLILCREYPPAPSGGIGTYVWHIAQMLAEAGETVHVIGQFWEGAERERETACDGRLVVHRVPFDDPAAVLRARPHPRMISPISRGLFESTLPAQAFAWEAGLLAERLVRQERIDVIEAQEYEAPLYFFQLRRALGLGPEHEPPCIVHLHSPTEFIARHNDWAPDYPLAVTSTRLEAFSNRAADALLCPSAWLARQVEARSAAGAPPVTVIHCPCSDDAPLVRDAAAWENGPVLYFGRLERRKGVLEWIDAAVKVARERDDVRFEFVGRNVLATAEASGEEQIRRRIPPELRPRFEFHEHRDRALLGKNIGRARLAVVPSRWENFPNTCVEAMAAGLPVLASPEGGMAEMIEHGRTGWIAASCSPDDLARALREALETGPDRLAHMGAEAAVAIRQLCDGRRIVARQIAFRDRVLRAGPNASLRLPRLPGVPAATPWEPATRSAAGKGLAVAVIDWGDPLRLQQTVSSIARQTVPPAIVLLVSAAAPGAPADTVVGDPDVDAGWIRVRGVFQNPAEARNRCLQEFRTASNAAAGAPLAAAFIDAGLRLEPEFVERCVPVLERDAAIGIVSGWAWCRDETGDLVAAPCPEFPHQWLHDDVGSFAVFRMRALDAVGGFRADLDPGFERWDAANAIVAAGWKTATYPAPLVSGLAASAVCPAPPRHTPATTHRRLLERFPDLVAGMALEGLLLAAESTRRAAPGEQPGAFGSASLLEAARIALRSPVASGRMLLHRVARRVRTAPVRWQNRKKPPPPSPAEPK